MQDICKLKLYTKTHFLFFVARSSTQRGEEMCICLVLCMCCSISRWQMWIHTHMMATWVQSVLFEKHDVVKPTCTHANHRGYAGQLQMWIGAGPKTRLFRCSQPLILGFKINGSIKAVFLMLQLNGAVHSNQYNNEMSANSKGYSE